MTLAFEPLGPEETNFINTVGGVDRTGPTASITQLPTQPRREGDEHGADADPGRDPLGEGVHRPRPGERPEPAGPGMGDVTYEPIIAALREVGCDGWLASRRSTTGRGWEAIARESIEYLKRVTGL